MKQCSLQSAHPTNPPIHTIWTVNGTRVGSWNPRHVQSNTLPIKPLKTMITSIVLLVATTTVPVLLAYRSLQHVHVLVSRLWSASVLAVHWRWAACITWTTWSITNHRSMWLTDCLCIPQWLERYGRCLYVMCIRVSICWHWHWPNLLCVFLIVVTSLNCLPCSTDRAQIWLHMDMVAFLLGVWWWAFMLHCTPSSSIQWRCMDSVAGYSTREVNPRYVVL